MPRKKNVPLPKAGDAFAVPLEDGRYSVCRVLIDRESYPNLSIDAVLCVGSSWIGDDIPEANNPALRSILILNHHSFNDQPLAQWTGDPVPEEFVPIGTIEPTPAECQPYYNWPSHGHWLRMQIQPFLQWRWDHEREAVLSEDAEQDRLEDLELARRRKDRQEFLELITLDDLCKHTFFENWSYPPEKVIEASRQVMSETVQKLSKLKKSASQKRRLQILQQCIEAFNALDEEYEFIDTVERDNIIEEFEAIVHACGLGDHEDLADEWRDW